MRDNIGILISISLLTIMVIVSLINYNKYKKTKLKFLPWIFILALFTEVYAYFLAYNKQYNVWLYNEYINIEYLFFIWLFYQYIEKKRFKKFMIVTTILYELYFLISIIFFSGDINVMQTYPFAFAQIIIIVILFTFMIQMLSSNNILHIQQYLIFWVAMGLLFYYIVPLPLNVSENLFRSDRISKEMVAFLHNIQFVGNILMYLSIIYGFIWSSKTYTSQ